MVLIWQTFYDVLELKIREIMARPDRGDKPQVELSSVLLIVMYVILDTPKFNF
jgi:exportin-5